MGLLFTTMARVNGLAAPLNPVWASYKDKLIEAGVLDARAKREIKIKAVNIETSPEEAMVTVGGDHDQSNSDSESTSTTILASKIVHFQRHGQGTYTCWRLAG